MHIVEIRAVNWMAFRGEHVLGPLPRGPIAIVGRYADNPRRSNWSGKTALLEVVRFVITEAHRKRVDDSLITHGEDRLEAGLTFSTGLVATRTRPRGGPTVLRVVDPVNAPGLVMERDAAEEHLAKVLRLPVDDFDNTSWFGQGDVQALCGKTSGVRRETFARWLELDVWERMGATAALAARTARANLESARRADLGTPPRSEEEIRKERSTLESRRLQAGADRDQIAHELEELVASASLAAAVTARRADHEAAKSAAATVRAQLQALPPATSEEDLVAMDERVGEAKAKQVAADREIQETQSLIGGRFDGQCPVTCEACPVSDEVAGKRSAFVERHRVAKATSQAAREEHATSSSAIAAARRVGQDRTRLVAQMNAATAKVRDAARALEEVETKAVREIQGNVEESRANARLALGRCDEDLRAIDAGIGRCDEELRHRERYAKQETARASAIGTAEREARIATLVARGLGGSGIPARIAAVSLTSLEARANALLASLGLSFTLTWERELADPAPACAECGHVYEKRTRARECPSCGAARSRKKSDELDVLVDDGSGEIEDVRAKSGGAKVLVASAIRLAGGMMLRERRGSPLEVAFVDEPFGELDLENRDSLARTFAGLLSSVGLEQAFVVSHDAQLLAGLPARIVVVRDGSSSRLELEA